jgi:hypothetical protein
MSIWTSPKTIRLVAWVGCFLLLFVSSFSLGGLNPPALGLDLSWQLVLEYAVEHHFQFGADIVFTYGPLGFVRTGTSQGHLIGARIVFAFFWSAVVALAATGFARRVQGWGRYAFLAWFVVFSLAGGFDQIVFFVMAYGAVILLDDDYTQRWQVPLFLFVFVVLSLIKFTFFIAAIGSLATIAGIRTLQGKIKLALVLVAVSCTGFITAWFALGQGLTNLPHWVKRNLEIASGYNAAMSLVPKVLVLRAMLAALFLFFFALALIIRRVPVNLPRMGIILTVTQYAFLAWKEGFVRADPAYGHPLIFIWFLPLAFGFFCLKDFWGALPARWRWTLLCLYAGTVVLCLAAAHFQAPNAAKHQLTNWPRHMQSNLEMIVEIVRGRAGGLFAARRNPALNREPVLARAKAAIGSETVDVMGNLQWAALANEMNYRPRPVIQGYSAYTPYLQDLNKAYFTSPNRPRFVLLSQHATDGKFPTLEDSAALNFVLNNYVPVARDGEFLVLRQTTAEDLSLQLVHEQALRFGEKLDVSHWAGKPLFMSVSIRPSLLGRFMALVYQARPLYIRLFKGTSEERYPIVPAMAERPFLLNPVLNSSFDVVDLYALSWKAMDSVAFERPPRASMQFRDIFTVRLYTAPGFLHAARSALTPQMVADLQGRAFWPEPLSVQGAGPPKVVDFHGSPGLLVHARGKVVVEIPKHAISFSGFFGILPGAYTGKGNTDGVEFSIDLQDKSGKIRRGFDRLVQPRTQVSDRGRLPFNIPIDGRRDRKVILNTGVGPRGNGSWDWSVWSNCRFEERKKQ